MLDRLLKLIRAAEHCLGKLRGSAAAVHDRKMHSHNARAQPQTRYGDALVLVFVSQRNTPQEGPSSSLRRPLTNFLHTGEWGL